MKFFRHVWRIWKGAIMLEENNVKMIQEIKDVIINSRNKISY